MSTNFFMKWFLSSSDQSLVNSKLLASAWRTLPVMRSKTSSLWTFDRSATFSDICSSVCFNYSLAKWRKFLYAILKTWSLLVSGKAPSKFLLARSATSWDTSKKEQNQREKIRLRWGPSLLLALRMKADNVWWAASLTFLSGSFVRMRQKW